MPGFTINNVTVSGNLTRDPDLRSLPSGTSVCALRMAVNERTKNSQTGEWEDRANFFDVTIWKGLGESVARQLSKGDTIVVSGRLRWREWQQDGGTRQAVDIVAESVVPVPRGDGARSSSSSSGQRQHAMAGGGDVPIDSSGLDGFGSAPADDDIPFLREPDDLGLAVWHGHQHRTGA